MVEAIIEKGGDYCITLYVALANMLPEPLPPAFEAAKGKFGATYLQRCNCRAAKRVARPILPRD
jgi:hypothetical protein